MKRDVDAIIIGAGHNGLVAAATLARAGQSVLVLERRAVLGGAAATEEVWPGYQVDTGAVDAGIFTDEVATALSLADHGLTFLESPVAVFAPAGAAPTGAASGLTLWRDATRSATEIGRLNLTDAGRYAAFARQVERLAGVLRAMFLVPPPDLGDLGLIDAAGWGRLALQVKRLGDSDMMALLRLLPSTVSDYLDEWFEDAFLKGVLGAAGVVGSHLGPRGAGTTLMFLYQHANGLHRTRRVKGGMGRLSAALAEAAREDGAEILLNTPVAGIRVDDYRATAVSLADGTEVSARVILSNLDANQTLLGLVGPTRLEPRVMRATRNILYRGTTARVNFALSGLPAFVGLRDEEQLAGVIRLSPSLDYLEKAYDDAKYGRVSARPQLDVRIPTVLDPGLAPDGRHIMIVTVRYAPYRLAEGDWDALREPLAEQITGQLDAAAPGLTSLIVERQAQTPADYERTMGLTEGSIFHGQMGLDQLLVMRPLPGWGRYRMPVEGLYLCGAGAHPGGGVTGAPGYNAAREALRELRA
jgi:phytoene dehydrogenase-like protein